MKTGIEVRDRAWRLLNYTDSSGQIDTAMYADAAARSLALVNQVYADIVYALCQTGFRELATLTDEIDLPEHVINDMMPYGVAMLTAQTLGDADNQSLFADLYNRKRAKLTRSSKRKDVLPYAL